MTEFLCNNRGARHALRGYIFGSETNFGGVLGLSIRAVRCHKGILTHFLYTSRGAPVFSLDKIFLYSESNNV